MTEKRLAHAYMLIGPDTPDRDRAAQRLAAALLCREADAPCGRCRDCRKVMERVHPDVTWVERQTGDKGQLRSEILVDQIRAVTSDAVIAPNEADRKVYILREADKMNVSAQNALLKALEEPPGGACFILCSASADALLPTVRSRCVREDETLREDTAPELSVMVSEYLRLTAERDIPGLTRFCYLRGDMSREDMERFLEQTDDALWRIQCGRGEDPGLDRETIFRLTALMEQGREYLRHNVSSRQIFGVLAVETLRKQKL